MNVKLYLQDMYRLMIHSPKKKKIKEFKRQSFKCYNAECKESFHLFTINARSPILHPSYSAQNHLLHSITRSASRKPYIPTRALSRMHPRLTCAENEEALSERTKKRKEKKGVSLEIKNKLATVHNMG